MSRTKRGKGPSFLSAGIVLTAVSLVAGWTWHSQPGYNLEAGAHVVERAFYSQESDLMVEVTGQVVRLIQPENLGPDLQQFQMRTPAGQLLLVEHNTSGFSHVPVGIRDEVTVRGNYQWSELGGIIDGTQRDTSLKRRHGWIEHEGTKYD